MLRKRIILSCCLLATVLFVGCGKTTESKSGEEYLENQVVEEVDKQKVINDENKVVENINTAESVDSTEKIEETSSEVANQEVKPLGTADFIATDGENAIVLGYPMDDFSIALEGGKELEGTNVGYIYLEEPDNNGIDTFKLFVRETEDFAIYTSNVGGKDMYRGFDDYYIYQIDLISPKYKTLRGVKVGDSKESVLALYGDDFEEEIVDNTWISYYFNNKRLSFVFNDDELLEIKMYNFTDNSYLR